MGVPGSFAFVVALRPGGYDPKLVYQQLSGHCRPLHWPPTSQRHAPLRRGADSKGGWPAGGWPPLCRVFETSGVLTSLGLDGAMQGKVVAVSQLQLAFIVTNVLLGNGLHGDTGLEVALRWCGEAYAPPPRRPPPEVEEDGARAPHPDAPSQALASEGVSRKIWLEPVSGGTKLNGAGGTI